ncbi:hypothetical protein O5264_28285, partial [Escherichia coli]|nr:hypothetical protein [Escherichia coli]
SDRPRVFLSEYTLQIDTRSGTPTLMISIQNAAEPVANLVRECPKWDGLPLTLDVSATFPEGAAVRDYYSSYFYWSLLWHAMFLHFPFLVVEV